MKPTLRTVTVTRYVTPLREGSSLPAIVEADDDGLYVLKFRGAGQGTKALIAELLAGEIARAIGLRVPEIVFANLDSELSRLEPDPEIQELLSASAGLNLALDYLPGSVTFTPLAMPVDGTLASRIVWFDCFVTNVDRTPRNVNMLVWHKNIWLIDHGAALYFHHAWRGWEEQARSQFSRVSDHILLPHASELQAIDAELRHYLTADKLDRIVALIPDDWLHGNAFGQHDLSAHDKRDVYKMFLRERLATSTIFVQEALRARETRV
ncbi:MAG: aminotransferase class I and II [Ignavibacteriae bacterium]|nr:aminotransferase class I and II [Ignavibacteriota bacterium]